MSNLKQEDVVKVEEKQTSRRKLIQKVRRKVKREEQRIATSYGNFAKQPRSGLGSFLNANPHDQCDFDMSNQITMGQNRKLKKKLKKLQKQMPANPEKVFTEIQKFKQGLYEHHQKKLFKPVNEMAKRRQKRKDKMEANARKRKAEVIQKKNLDRFE